MSSEEATALVPSQQQKAPPVGKMEALTGLRGVMAVYVVVYHFFGDFRNGELLGTKSADRLVGHGFVAVTFFFQLSGFVNTAVAESRGADYGERFRRRFWRRRAARLAPAYFASMLLFAPLVWFAWPPSTPPFDARVARFAALATTPLGLQTWAPYPLWRLANYPAWAVSCELFFYLAFPFLAPRLRTSWPATMLVVLGMAQFATSAAAYSLLGATPLAADVVYVWPVVRIFEFAQGIVLGFWRPHFFAHAVDVAAALVIALLIAVPRSWPPACVTLVLQLPVAFLIASAAHDQGLIAYLCRSRTAIVAGEISYCTYLLQAPLMLALLWCLDPAHDLPAIFDMLLARAIGERPPSPILPLSALPLVLLSLHTVAKFLYDFLELPALSYLTADSPPLPKERGPETPVVC
ncbi:hypothetical protein CTAYLR_007202 [Chrysophaeum taylorii]|uniref:Acyltransferase 3 domain-containing protein n=1 Tax=Chrysophaeum taylorii TaxID=2483200 RepID=A0AAD7UMV4_9STRA|nr:hypothetical protein CTAYLR_007202 [Chrysophaeum taylorii]